MMMSAVHEHQEQLGARPSKKSKISSVLNIQEHQDKVALRQTELRASVQEETASVLSRRGSILGRGRMLKADHFPSCRNTQLPVQIDSAPNIRDLSDRKIYGVGQPTAEGISDVLNHVKESQVVWVNLREEPFVFINGHPYCVKDWKQPFDNIERTGITTEQVQADEETLKREILEESRRYGGKILLHGETVPEGDNSVAAMGEVYCYWEDIDMESVVCYHTLCECFQGDKNVTFHRIPVTDEHTFQEKDFDRIYSILAHAPDDAALVFNCQMGRGRATTGMVVGTMLWQLLKHNEVYSNSVLSSPSLGTGGMQFSAVVELTQLISGVISGRECVESVDACVELCADMQNIREAVVIRREKAAKYAARGAPRKEAKELGVARHYLERYMFLVLYQAHLDESAQFSAAGASTVTFTEWMANHSNRTAIYTLIDQMTLEDFCMSRSSSYDSEASTDTSLTQD